MLLLAPHLLLHFFSGFEASAIDHVDADQAAQFVGTGRLLGTLSAIGLLALVVISLGQISRILRLPYERCACTASPACCS
ncbi:hypothetical protein [Streptomyces sioyaensis]|uniref:hypothetical protein n=1 Tax=Streptomyces sioyaensis TaxID=67364 RepID=UPI003787E451